tara:strand:+ start:4463 stop:4771 length:309 start_codon:yes stop_codon:yes gene_type:complete
MNSEMPALVAVIAITMGLIKVIEMLILKTVNKGSALTQEERNWLQGLHELHERCDTDGTPLVYVPRSWAEIQRNMQHIMTKIVNDQRRIADILERIDKKLDD